LISRLKYLVQDPPPQLIFEISDRGVSAARLDSKTYKPAANAHRALPGGTLQTAPGRPNVQEPEIFAGVIESLLEELGPARSPDAALILPDGAARLTVLEFDNFPGDDKERLSLIRFRLKKTVPFDIERARIAYQPQSVSGGISALVAVMLPDVVSQYEAPFKHAGLRPGYVSLSTAAALNLVDGSGVTMLAKLAGRSLTMAATQNGAVRALRTVAVAPSVDLESPDSLHDILADLFPTFVFVGDSLGSPVTKLALCGFGPLLNDALTLWPHELGCEVEPLRSSSGAIEGHDAGIWGYLSIQ
jgi:type IV pilus assembly protein PilM